MMKTGLIAAAALAALLGACSQKAATPEKTVQQLMAQDVQPTAKIYWDSVQFVSDETGDHDIKPETDADWARTKAAATRLGEFAELLKTPGYTEGRNADWTQFASSLADVSKQAEQAAVEKSPDKVFEVGGTMYSVCSACHLVYPATTGPEASETPST